SLPSLTRKVERGARGAQGSGVRRPGRAHLRGPSSPRAPARGRSLWRSPRSQKPPIPGGRQSSRSRATSEADRGPRPDERHHGRLQPHFIASFFLEAFKGLGGTVQERETKRYEIKHVAGLIRNRDRQIGRGQPVLLRYERITFEKPLINPAGKPLADFVCPGHPLLDATLDLVLERHRDLLKRGTVLVDENDQGEEVRPMLYLEHTIQDARTDRAGNRRTVSKRLQFVEITGQGKVRSGG